VLPPELIESVLVVARASKFHFPYARFEFVQPLAMVLQRRVALAEAAPHLDAEKQNGDELGDGYSEKNVSGAHGV
jgi:hypothetical protein